MYFLLFIVLLILAFVFVLFEVPSQILCVLDTDRNIFYGVLSWLSPLLKVEFEMVDYSPCLTFYLFHKRIATKTLQKRTGKNKYNLKAISLKNSYITLNYGLVNPFSTGIANGIIEAFYSFFHDIYFESIPDFFPDHEYIVVKAKSDLNIGETIINIIRLRTHKNNKRSDKYGSIEYN